jgi:hypothetical protein
MATKDPGPSWEQLTPAQQYRLDKVFKLFMMAKQRMLEEAEK